jgi:glyoxylase-like metal-dependent hydrolase (beta-lactamase superfamily II)
MTNNQNAKTAESTPLELRHRTVGTWSVNAYAFVCMETRQSVLIDPGGEPDALEEMLEGSRPAAILITHSHPDHTGVLQTMRDRLSVPVMAHAGSPDDPSRITADRWLEHGDTLSLGSHRLNIVHTPGHTTDQICFFPDNDFRVVVGDTIFDGGPGKTWSSQDFQRTLMTLREIVLPWPDQTVCYPGHGASFKLGDIRQAIQTFLEKEHGDFYGDAVW